MARGRAATAAHGTPQSPGYTFRLRGEWGGRCGAGGRAWQVTPVWYQESAAQLEHLEQNLRGEERMAARASPDERGDLEAQIGRDRDALAARRRALSQQVDANERVTGTRAAADARQAGCVDNGLHVESDALYAVWCCQ
jgi:hypothetical protein